MASTHCPIHWRTFGCWRTLEGKNTVKSRKITVYAVCSITAQWSPHQKFQHMALAGAARTDRASIQKPPTPFAPLNLLCVAAATTESSWNSGLKTTNPALPQKSPTHPPTTLAPKSRACNWFTNCPEEPTWLTSKPCFSQVSSQSAQLLCLNCFKNACANAAEGLRFFLLTTGNNLSLDATLTRTLESMKNRKLPVSTPRQGKTHRGVSRQLQRAPLPLIHKSRWFVAAGSSETSHYSQNMGGEIILPLTYQIPFQYAKARSPKASILQA